MALSVDDYVWVPIPKVKTPQPESAIVAVFRNYWWVSQKGAVGFVKEGNIPALSTDRTESVTSAPEGCDVTYLPLAFVPVDLGGESPVFTLPR